MPNFLTMVCKFEKNSEHIKIRLCRGICTQSSLENNISSLSKMKMTQHCHYDISEGTKEK